MMMAEEGKQITWFVVLFCNLYSHIWDFLVLSKSKESVRKEPKFGPTHVINILLQKWFPLELKTRLSESNLDDEDDDLEFFN